jgi:hypothetical protein
MEELNTIHEYFERLDFPISIQEIDYQTNADLTILLNGEKVTVEIKSELRPEQANRWTMWQYGVPLLVMAKYITPAAKDILKSSGINYIDSFGNAFIALNSLKMYVEKGDARPVYNDYNQIFTATGAKVLFHLLANEDNINSNYRHLSFLSGVSLGSVSKLMHGLFKESFAVKIKSRKFQLVKKDELMERWIILLNEKILPAQKIGNFRFRNTNWKDVYLSPDTKWAGEPAAALITKYLNPEKFTLFTFASKNEIISGMQMLPDPAGEITIYKPFWNAIEHEFDLPIVHPLIVYAQLVYSGNSRNKETADIIYHKHLQHEL